MKPAMTVDRFAGAWQCTIDDNGHSLIVGRFQTVAECCRLAQREGFRVVYAEPWNDRAARMSAQSGRDHTDAGAGRV